MFPREVGAEQVLEACRTALHSRPSGTLLENVEAMWRRGMHTEAYLGAREMERRHPENARARWFREFLERGETTQSRTTISLVGSR